MSMIGNLYAVGDERVRSLLADPTSVHEVVEVAYEVGNDRFVDLAKAWHCLHYLLTGRVEGGDPPLNFIAGGGTEVGDEDVGYGPARAFLSSDVVAISDALRPLSHGDLVRRFDARRMDELEIYPDTGRWSDVDPNSEEEFGYYLAAFDAAKALVERARAQGLGLLAWLSSGASSTSHVGQRAVGRRGLRRAVAISRVREVLLVPRSHYWDQPESV